MSYVSTTNNADDKPKCYCHLKKFIVAEIWKQYFRRLSLQCIYFLPGDNHDLKLALSVILVNSELCLLCKMGSNSDGCSCISMLVAVFYNTFSTHLLKRTLFAQYSTVCYWAIFVIWSSSDTPVAESLGIRQSLACGAPSGFSWRLKIGHIWGIFKTKDLKIQILTFEDLKTVLFCHILPQICDA